MYYTGYDCAYVGCDSYRLVVMRARRVTGQDPETAMFAGIVHEVGGFYLLSRAKDDPGLLDGDLTEWLQDDDFGIEDVDQAGEDSSEARIGRTALKALSVPRAVIDGIEAMWKGYLTPPLAVRTAGRSGWCNLRCIMICANRALPPRPHADA